ncbi:MAG TPA: formate dehydrogenase accessory protein FdhE [Hyphomicrobiaceae bacterium]|nr:formate dehydrogenase accessory protein FdhE [Hyphomicrobiaceae bacterium]
MSEGGQVKSGLMSIGEEAKPPFAVAPAPVAVFAARAARLEALAAGHAVEGYLRLVAGICQAQAEVVTGLPPVSAPLASHQGMPPLQVDTLQVEGSLEETLVALSHALANLDAPADFKVAIGRIRDREPEARRALLAAIVDGEGAGDDIATEVIATAALQVHLTRLAALVDAEKLEPVADGVCPACGSPPVASAVVSWPNASNTRFCTCSLCATQWHVVRLKCASCGSTAGVSYPHIEGQKETLRAETCDVCRRYVKIVYQIKDPAHEPFADDIATLDLDLVLKAEGWTRGGRNPFLLGY